MNVIYLITWWVIVSFPGPCPDHIQGCLVIHYRNEYLKNKEIMFDQKKATKFCEGKDQCSVEALSEERLNNILNGSFCVF